VTGPNRLEEKEGKAMKQKTWNAVTAASLAALAAGVLLAKVLPLAGRGLVVIGIAAFLLSMAGSSRSIKAYRCPVCGEQLRPMGRWFPGLPQSASLRCLHCGVSFSLEELEKKDASQTHDP